jgi:hypothetical protein
MFQESYQYWRYYHISIFSLPSPNGWIWVDGVPAEFFVQANWSLIQKEVKGQSLIFCPVTVSLSEKFLTFKAWVFPFPWSVWLAFLISLLGMLIPYMITNFTNDKITLLGIANHFVIDIFGATMRQSVENPS